MITDKLKSLEENLNILNKIKDDYTLNDIVSNKVDEWGLRYGLLESIQIIIDLSCSIVSERNLGIPKNYSDCINLIINNNYLEKELGKRILSMVGLRNLLVHEYGIIDVNKLYEYLKYLQDLKDFAVVISKL
ncbi:MAG: hypothetical protein B6D44_02050 [Ignavibacteriales bacterium UTCHB2]|jgi:uncharacterized protein YutE (UPF0331/DUF86 family)|nr:MAG: hypothetical protein B6D44_02050 [Ignavibacteriales bacterium UTCHB2]HQI41296.1 DUF86 domain-containing protein [Ignavibacteriaceae bacterium]